MYYLYDAMYICKWHYSRSIRLTICHFGSWVTIKTSVNILYYCRLWYLQNRTQLESYRIEIANLKRSIQDKDLLLERSKEMLKIAAEREDELLREVRNPLSIRPFTRHKSLLRPAFYKTFFLSFIFSYNFDLEPCGISPIRSKRSLL